MNKESSLVGLLGARTFIKWFAWLGLAYSTFMDSVVIAYQTQIQDILSDNVLFKDFVPYLPVIANIGMIYYPVYCMAFTFLLIGLYQERPGFFLPLLTILAVDTVVQAICTFWILVSCDYAVFKLINFGLITCISCLVWHKVYTYYQDLKELAKEKNCGWKVEIIGGEEQPC